MDGRFSKLRFKEFAKAAAAGAIVGAVALQATPAPAATGSVRVNAGNAEWWVNTNITFSTTSSGGLAMSEASLHTAAASTANSYNRGDSYDGALSWHVSTAPFTGAQSGNTYQSPGGVAVVPPLPHASNLATTVTGTTQVMAGLNVHVQLYFSPVKAVVRSVLYLQNPTGAPITVNAFNASNLGSDANTTLLATSSGDAVADASDNWFVSCQESVSPGTCDASLDPVVTVALSGATGGNRGTQVATPGNGSNPSPCPNKDKVCQNYVVTVPAGETRAVMIFSQISDTQANATADAALFNSNELQRTDYLTGLTPTEMAEIVNWSISSVPTLTQWAQAGMALLLSVAGLFSLRAFGWRRRRSA